MWRKFSLGMMGFRRVQIRAFSIGLCKRGYTYALRIGLCDEKEICRVTSVDVRCLLASIKKKDKRDLLANIGQFACTSDRSEFKLR